MKAGFYMHPAAHSVEPLQSASNFWQMSRRLRSGARTIALFILTLAMALALLLCLV